MTSLTEPFKHLSIKQKLLLVYLIITLALSSFGIYLFNRLGLVNQAFTTIDQRYSRLNDVLTIEVDSRELTNTVKSYVLTQDPIWQSTYNHTSLGLDQALNTLSQSHPNADEVRAIDQYQTITGKLKGTELFILAEVKEGDIKRAQSLFDLGYETQQSEATGLITGLVSNESTGVKTTIDQSRSQVAIAQRNLVLVLALITILALLFFYIFASTIARAIQALIQAALKFAQGDFGTRVQITSSDEIGRLGGVFNTMAGQLQQTYSRLNHTLGEVTQRTQQLGEEKARFSASIDSLPLGFIMTNANNAVLDLNPAMQHMLGIDTHGLDSTKINQQLTTTAGLLEQLLERSRECLTKKQPLDIGEITEKGKIYRAFISPVLTKTGQDPQAIGTAILVEDITEERVMARSKDEFFSIASHELRTPLTAIRGNTSLIQQYYKDQLKDAALGEMVGDIHESSVRLIDIVNDFLDASRLEQGKMQFELEDFAIEPLIGKIVYELDGVTREKHIQLRMTDKLDSLPHVYADINKVKQIIYNLVGNAVKFVEKGNITIDAKPQGKLLKVYITDTGKGISPENQQILFHKFQQAGSSILTRDNTRGTGLGLYISKLLVEKMGGTIALERSEVGKGSTFSFTLPLVHAPNNQPKDPKAP